MYFQMGRWTLAIEVARGNNQRRYKQITETILEMGKTKLIFDTYDIEKASSEILQNIDKAVVASAFRIRDDAR